MQVNCAHGNYRRGRSSAYVLSIILQSQAQKGLRERASNPAQAVSVWAHWSDGENAISNAWLADSTEPMVGRQYSEKEASTKIETQPGAHRVCVSLHQSESHEVVLVVVLHIQGCITNHFSSPWKLRKLKTENTCVQYLQDFMSVYQGLKVLTRLEALYVFESMNATPGLRLFWREKNNLVLSL